MVFLRTQNDLSVPAQKHQLRTSFEHPSPPQNPHPKSSLHATANAIRRSAAPGTGRRPAAAMAGGGGGGGRRRQPAASATVADRQRAVTAGGGRTLRFRSSRRGQLAHPAPSPSCLQISLLPLYRRLMQILLWTSDTQMPRSYIHGTH